MIKLGNVDSQIVWLLAMMQDKGVGSPKIVDLLDKLSPGPAREIGEVLSGRSRFDLAFPDVQKFIRDLKKDLNKGMKDKNGR